MTALPFFPLATDAFLADTDHLDDAERGRYVSILIALWRAPKQRLPNDDAWLAKKFRRDVERVLSDLRPLIVEFCQCDGNWITQKRLSKEFARASKAVAQRRDAANARWLKQKLESERIAGSYRGRIASTLIPTPTLSSSSDISTDAAREPSPERSRSGSRAKALTVKERMAALAKAHHQKFAERT